MVVKRVSSDHYMQLWRHLVDNREIIVTGSTYPWLIPPRSPYVLHLVLDKGSTVCMLYSYTTIESRNFLNTSLAIATQARYFGSS